MGGREGIMGLWGIGVRPCKALEEVARLSFQGCSGCELKEERGILARVYLLLNIIDM